MTAFSECFTVGELRSMDAVVEVVRRVPGRKCSVTIPGDTR